MGSKISMGLVYENTKSMFFELEKIIKYITKNNSKLKKVSFSIDEIGCQWEEYELSHNEQIKKHLQFLIDGYFGNIEIIVTSICKLGWVYVYIRLYKEDGFFGFLLDFDEEQLFQFASLEEIEEVMVRMLLELFAVTQYDYAFCDNEAEIQYSPHFFRNQGENIYSIAVIPLYESLRLRPIVKKSNWRIDGLSTR